MIKNKLDNYFTNNLIKEIKSDRNQLKYSFGEKDRTKTIITVEAYIEEKENEK